MSRHDYTKHSKKNQNEVDETEEVKEIVEEIEATEDVEQPAEIKEYKLGIVKGCTKLRVRSEPRFGTNVICEIEQGTRVMIDADESTLDYYKIYTESGIEGFCLKAYIV